MKQACCTRVDIPGIRGESGIGGAGGGAGGAGGSGGGVGRVTVGGGVVVLPVTMIFFLCLTLWRRNFLLNFSTSCM
jgi:hypothetical protein